jgi:hypothetical protein
MSLSNLSNVLGNTGESAAAVAAAQRAVEIDERLAAENPRTVRARSREESLQFGNPAA